MHPYHMPPPVHHPAAPLPGHPVVHPAGVLPHMQPHAPGAPPPIWGHHAPPMHPPQRQFGQGVPVSPRSMPAPVLGARQGSAGSVASGGSASPLNPHSAVFTPSGRAEVSSPSLPAAHSPVAASAASAELPQQPLPAGLVPEVVGSSSGSSSGDVGAGEKLQQLNIQEQSSPQQPAAAPASASEAPPVAAAVAAAEGAPMQQQQPSVEVPAGIAPVQVVATALEPEGPVQPPAAQPAAAVEQQQQQPPTLAEQVQGAEGAVAPALPDGTANAAAGADAVPEPAAAAASVAPPAAQAPAAPKSWAALAASQAAPVSTQFRPHTTPQRAPGHTPPPSLQQQQRQQQQHPHPHAHPHAAHAGRGGRGHYGGREGPHSGRSRGRHGHSGSRDGRDFLAPHHQQPVMISSQANGGSPRATRSAASAASAPTAITAAAAPAVASQLPEAMRPPSAGTDAAAAAAAAAAVARVEPRGLFNPGNLCFMNSILQALLGSSRFCQLLAALRKAAPELDAAATPTLAALAELAAEFKPVEAPRERQGGGAAAEDGQQQGVGAAAAGAAKAAGLLMLGDRPLMPGMLMEVVNSFRPHGCGAGGGATSTCSIVLGPGKSNGSTGPMSLQASPCATIAAVLPCPSRCRVAPGPLLLRPCTHRRSRHPPCRPAASAFLPGRLPCSLGGSRRMLTTFWSTWSTACTRSGRACRAAAPRCLPRRRPPPPTRPRRLRRTSG